MYDLVVKGATVVRPGFPDEILDIGVADGRFVEIAPDLGRHHGDEGPREKKNRHRHAPAPNERV